MTDKILIDRSVLEQALEALTHAEQDCADFQRVNTDQTGEAIEALRAALEQQPQGEQEPVAWIENIGGGVSYNPYHEAARKLPDGVRFDLYTHPQPKREPLTDGQINDHRLALPYDGEDLPDPWDFKQGVKAAERAHKIGGEA